MYCDSDTLADICKEIKGLALKEIYPDWGNGMIYLLFTNLCKTVILTIKNNYHAGMSILEPISNYSMCQIESEGVQLVE